LDQNINSNQYTHDSTDVDFIRDDVLAPIGSGFSEGEYFGLEPSPDIDDLIDNENARTEADTYDKFIGVDVVLPNSGDTKLMAKVVKKVKSDDRNNSDTYNANVPHFLLDRLGPVTSPRSAIYLVSMFH